MTRRTYDLLTASPANVQANPPTSRLYQWLRNGSAISGATGQTYMTTVEDDGAVISVQQTETNFLGTATLTSQPSAQQVSSTLEQRVAELFSNDEQGAWYDPSDFSTLYQDSAGTTPVTAVEQPVGLMLDRSKGLVLGSELATVSSLTADPIGGPTFTNYAVSGVLTQNRWYKISFTVSNYTGTNTVGIAGSVARFEPDLSNSSIAEDGTVTVIGFWTASGVAMELFNRDTNTCTFTNISVRELPGNHAFQSSSASRPVLRARYNLLTYTEQFDNAAWTKSRATITANAGVAPDGTTTADKLVEDTATGTHRLFVLTAKAASALQYTYSVYLKAAERTFAQIKIADGTESDSAALNINLSTGAISGPSESGFTGASATITALANGWYRVTLTATTDTDTNISVFVFVASALGTVNYTGDGTSGIYVWGAQLLTAADHAATGGAYQRIGAATDYDTGPPWRPYLAFDGSDDSMSTSSIDFSGTDKMTVFAGVTKLSDAAQGTIVELSGDINNNGIFLAIAPQSANEYFWRSKGTSVASAIADSVTYAAPVTNVFTGIGDIGADKSILRLDGLQVDLDSGDQGTGNFGNYPLFIGRRNNASNPFNGRFYSLAVLGRTATAAELTRTEMYMASKTGVTL